MIVETECTPRWHQSIQTIATAADPVSQKCYRTVREHLKLRSCSYLLLTLTLYIWKNLTECASHFYGSEDRGSQVVPPTLNNFAIHFSSSKDGQLASIEHDHSHIAICPSPRQSLGYLLEGIQEFAAQNVFELCESCLGQWGLGVEQQLCESQGSVRPEGKVDTAFFNYRLLRRSVHRFRMSVLVVYMRKLGSWPCKFAQLT